MSHQATNPASPSRNHHMPALDGIRGFAILWVVLHNCMDVLAAPPTGPFHVLAMLTHPGWIGVQIFFVLSGFLITGNLLDSQQSKNYFSSFYARRMLRIFPLYYAVLLGGLVIWPMLFGTPEVLRAALRNQVWLWFHLTNWTHENLGGFGHFWSLAVEEQFYLFWPLLIYRMPIRRLFLICIGIASLALAIRSSMALAGFPAMVVYTSTVCRMDALSLGAAAAALIRIPDLRDWLVRNLRALACGAALLFLIGIPLTRGYSFADLACEIFGYTILALVSAIFVLGTALSEGDTKRWVPALLCNPALRSLGKYSYAIYVFHLPLHKFIGLQLLHSTYGSKLPPMIVVSYAIAMLLLSYILAFCSYHGFEKHFLRLKRYFAPRETLANQPTMT